MPSICSPLHGSITPRGVAIAAAAVPRIEWIRIRRSRKAHVSLIARKFIPFVLQIAARLSVPSLELRHIHVCRDHPIGCPAAFYPCLQITQVIDLAGSIATTAVIDSRQNEQTKEV